MNSLFVKKKSSKHSLFVIQLILILFWGFQLISSDAYYVNYAVLLMITSVCIFDNNKNRKTLLEAKHEKHVDRMINIFAVLFSCMVAFSNYSLWTAVLPADYRYNRFDWYYHYFMMILLLLGGFFAFKNIIISFVRNLKLFIWKKCDNTIKPQIAFIVCFGLLMLTRMIVLFYSQYPGNLTPDSLDQIDQLLSNSYSNHHPFYHTMVIKLFMMIGMFFFDDINAAVATYSVFQILFTSLCFSFSVSTVAKMKAPRWIVIVSILFFVLMPYHITYAITMWKDVMFGCFILLLVTSIYRYMYNVGNMFINHLIIMMSSIGICLFRSNGYFAFVLLTLAIIILWKVKNNRMLIMFISTIIISFILKHVILAGLDVKQPDIMESLSIPAQQIARVVQEGRELNDWERKLLNNVIDIEQIPEHYASHIADPIKSLVRQRGNLHLLTEQKMDYIKLYLSLGIKYPIAYLRAWIDQTRGYWNAGYGYWRWFTDVYQNNLGIEKKINNLSVNLFFDEYLFLFTDIHGLRLFLSIGLFVWIDILMLMVAMLRKDKIGIFVSLPILVIVMSLLIATPVFSEFRYIYAAFCTLPMIIPIVLRPLDDIEIFRATCSKAALQA